MIVLLSRIARAAALLLLILALVDPPLGRARAPEPLVALDISESWTRGGDTLAWRRAVARFEELRAGRGGLLAGDSASIDAPPLMPSAGSADLQAILGRGAAEGRPVVLITDGEAARIDTTQAPAGSRLEVIRPARGPDLAIERVSAPAATPERDTVSVTLRLVADQSGSSGGSVELTIDGKSWGEVAVPALDPFGTTDATVRGRMPSGRGAARVTAIARSAGDGEPRNDTARVGIARAPVVTAVFISTSPDFDARFVAAALEETVSLPLRAFFQIAPGAWRTGEGAAVGRDAVLFAGVASPLVALHGDTAHFGPPRRVFTGALALLPRVRETGDWIAGASPASPLSPLLADVQWDSLRPLAADAGPSGASWVGLQANRSGAEPRRIVTGFEGARRVVVVTAAGTYSWKMRGGVAADAHAALWGGVFDWLVEKQSGIPEAPSFQPVSRELIPAAPVMRSSSFGSVAVARDERRARDWPILYVMIVGFLCIEWILRRRAGLR